MRDRLDGATLYVTDRRRAVREEEFDLTADEIVERWTTAAIGNVVELHAGAQPEHFKAQVLHSAVARRGPVESAWRRLGDRDHIADALGRNRIVDHENVRHQRGKEHRLEILDRIVRQSRIEGWIHRMCRAVVEYGVAVAV